MGRRIGEFRARAISEGAKWTAAGTGTRQVGIMFAIVGGRLDGQLFRYIGSLGPKSADRTVQSLAYAGVDVTTSSSIIALNGLGSRDCRVTLEEDDRDGATYTQVAWVNDLGVNLPGDLNEGELRDLGGTLDALLQSGTGRNGNGKSDAWEKGPPEGF